MKRSTASLLRAAVVLVAIGALSFLLWEPHGEGVNAGATTLSEIYFDDPFLAYAYLSSVPFFVGLFQLFTLAGLAGRDQFFSRASAKALKTIKYCAIVMIPFIVGGLTWLMFSESDDRPPLVMMATIAIVICISVAMGASGQEERVKKAL